MLEQSFLDIYTKFKLQFYRKIFNRFESREATLTAVETFCVEAIYALGQPTVNEFAHFVQISPANAAYKVNNLIKKGYVIKERSQADKREYHLLVTEKFMDYYGLSAGYVEVVSARIRKRFPKDDIQKLEQILKIVDEELMAELPSCKNPKPAD